MSVRIYTNKYNVLYLDIRYSEGRERKSTKLKDTIANRTLLKKKVIPKIELQILEGEYKSKVKQEYIDITVEKYGYRSLCRHKSSKRAHVHKAYIQHFENKVIPFFGDRNIDTISAIELMDWQNKLLEKHTASTVKKYRTVFNVIFEDARKELINGAKLIQDNPFRDVSVPKKTDVYVNNILVDDEKNVDPFTFEEIEHLLLKAKGYMRNFIGIASRTGIRPGEMVSLTWDNIDFENELISVETTRIRGKTSKTKTLRSYRTVEMLFGVKEFFMEQFKITGKFGKQVFLNKSHKAFYSHDIVAVNFKKLLNKKDTRYLYQLRHSFATMMISENEDILWVSKMLGHKDSNITLQVYAKAYNMKMKKSERKERALFLNKGQTMGIVDNSNLINTEK